MSRRFRRFLLGPLSISLIVFLTAAQPSAESPNHLSLPPASRTDCGFYDAECTANSDFHSCQVAHRVCPIFGHSDRADCMRECLQVEFEAAMPLPYGRVATAAILFDHHVTCLMHCW
ncbi:MAG TPA: hypothetical protein VL588_11735 [Bdellovibrionota bacterium]|nr:hypothetical protein [Bdellovibrionota bacterium]